MLSLFGSAFVASPPIDVRLLVVDRLLAHGVDLGREGVLDPRGAIRTTCHCDY
jgi:hypothetical protein